MSAADLVAEFGLASVTFGRDVPRAWRPYYLGSLQTALQDMQRVFPALSFAGLHVQFGNQTLPDSALAMHDPRTRTIQLSIASSAGTIAHELSHDLDWQTARRMYANGRGYSTDRAMRGPSRRARRVGARARRGARDSRSGPGGGPSAPAHNDRPAELFARSVDWFVASTLAHAGPMNGFLSAVQDPMLPGYAAGAPAAVGTAGAESLLGALAQMTYIPDSARDAFESQWSDPAIIDPTLLVRRVLDTPISWRVVWQQLARPPNTQANASHARRAFDGALRRRASRPKLRRATGCSCWRSTRAPAAPRFGARDTIRRACAAEWANSAARDAALAHRRRRVGDRRAALVGRERAIERARAQGVVPVVPAIFRSSAASCSSIAR